jgi:DNA polymerase elongation subunit (family B)
MKAWLIDSYRKEKSIVLWLRQNDINLKVEYKFNTEVLIDINLESTNFIKKNRVRHNIITQETYDRKKRKLYSIPIYNLYKYERMVRWIERQTKHRVALYNADIKPEQHFLYKKRLTPFTLIKFTSYQIWPLGVRGEPSLTKAKIQIEIKNKNQIKKIVINKKVLNGSEIEVLQRFVKEFKSLDPDIIIIKNAFKVLPFIVQRLQTYNLSCPFHRWDDQTIKYKGGKSFYSYGNVRYQHFSIKLRGRFLLDLDSTIGSSCDSEGIMELSQLSGTGFQQIASRSYGAVFQQSLVRLMVEFGYVVPFKQKPHDKPLNMLQMVKSDRAGHTFDPKVGFHKNVAEIDFSSMFPWLIYNHNISADTILCEEGPFDYVPGVPIRVSKKFKGLVPLAIKPIIDRRMYYKANRSHVNDKRAAALKMVLVTCYGYLRFREFKLGLASSHMAICAYARFNLMKAAKLVESKGYKIVHGIIDSLYIYKPNINPVEVKELCKDIHILTGIPMSYEGIFKWVVFLPSINNPDRALPAKYFGVFKDGRVKVRGLEVRQKNTTHLVKDFQNEVLDLMAKCKTKKEIKKLLPHCILILKKNVKSLNFKSEKELQTSVCLQKEKYKTNIPQRTVLKLLRSKGYEVFPGQTASFVYQQDKVVLPQDYNGLPNKKVYTKLLIRSLYILFLVFGVKKEEIESEVKEEKQMVLSTTFL